MDIGIILAFVGGILTIISLGYTVWQTKSKIEELRRENERLKDEIATIKAENIGEYPERDLRRITELLGKSTQEISILGFIGWQRIHEARSLIVDLINIHNGKVRILIANPNSKYFNDRAARGKDTVGRKERLLQEHKLTIAEIKGILARINPKRERNLRIKMYKELRRDVSLQIVDNKEIYVNDRIEKEGVRGYETPMYKVSKERLAQRITFEYLKEIFEDTWNNESTEEINLNTDQ